MTFYFIYLGNPCKLLMLDTNGQIMKPTHANWLLSYGDFVQYGYNNKCSIMPLHIPPTCANII